MAALDELTAAWQEAMADPAFTDEFHAHAPRVRRGAEPALRRDPAQRAGRRRPDPAQARGPQPHRRAQDPQRARPGAAHQADGQDPDDRRDRCRPARRRDGHRGGVPRPRLHGLHGRGRHRAAGAQRGADAAARRRGDPGRLRHAHPQGRHQRGDPRLGRHRRPHRLLLRHRRRPAPVPGMVRDFCRGIGDEARAQCLELYRRAARRGRRLRRRRLQRDRAVHGLPRRRRRPDLRLRGRGEGVDTARHAATIWAGEVGVLHGARTYVLQDEDGQTVESHSISAGLDYPGVGPQHAHLAKTGRATYLPVTDAEAMDALAAARPHRGDHPGDRVRARASPARSTWPRSRPPRRRSW